MGFSMSVAGAAFGAAGAYKGARSKRDAYRQQGQIDLNNAQVAEWQAQQAEAVGADQEQGSRLRTAQVLGEERAGLAASGVDLGQGSATEVLAGTKLIGEHDALTIRDNANRAAWGYRTQKTNFENEAAMSFSAASSINPGMEAFGSLLGSAGSVDKSWQTNMTKSGGRSGFPSWMGS